MNKKYRNSAIISSEYVASSRGLNINFIEYLEETVNRASNKVAVIDSDGNKFTFSELSQKALIIATIIGKLSDSTRNPVAVFLPKSFDGIVSDLGIIYSGNAYMNLDIKTPQNRIKNILDLVKPIALITISKYLHITTDICPDTVNIINLDYVDFNSKVDRKAIDEKRNKLIDTDPLCIINTSGSTGTPKGVVLNHKSFIDFSEWAFSTFDFSYDEIIGSLSPMVFDIYSFELCMMAFKGSTLVLISDAYSAFPIKILQVLAIYNVSFIFWVPTIMVNIANMALLEQISLPSLRTVWFAGEVFPTKQFNLWRRNMPQSLFVNLYGPIEITLDCTYYIVNRKLDDNEPIPIGYPCRNTDILILSAENTLVTEQGKEGELCVRGTSLAMGYYNNSEKTCEVFVQNPLNNSYPEIIYRTGDIVYKNNKGELVFKGRNDSLIKHLGYRIELGEIEHVVVNTLKLVRNGCVVYNFKNKEIVLFYEANEDLSIAEMKKAIGEILPRYMVPSAYKKMIVLPRNLNGKIDRLALNNSINE